MSWSRAILPALLLLAACGFTPAYGPNGDARGLLGEIDVAPPADATGFALVRALEGRLGLPENAAWRLEADILIDRQGLGVTPSQQITRQTLLGEAPWRLVEISTGDVVARGRASAFTGYSTTSTSVASFAARRDAEQRLMTMLADEIVGELLVTASDWRQ